MKTILVPGVAWPAYTFTKQPKIPRQPRVVNKSGGCKARILSYLEDNPGSTATGAASGIGICYATADITLRRLHKHGLVRRAKRTTVNGSIYEYWRN